MVLRALSPWAASTAGRARRIEQMASMLALNQARCIRRCWLSNRADRIALGVSSNRRARFYALTQPASAGEMSAGSRFRRTRCLLPSAGGS
jgi:hypothetical protein